MEDWLLADLNIEAVATDPAGLVARYEFEGNTNDTGGVYNAAPTAAATYTDGHVGGTQAIEIDDTYYVTVTGYKGVVDGNPFSVTAWVKSTGSGDRTIASWGTSTSRERVDFRLYQGRIRIEHGQSHGSRRTANLGGSA